MKTELPEKSHIIKDKLAIITAKILSVAEDKICKIILFGSYARGNWVRDTYIEALKCYSYESDLDILIILKKKYYTNLHKSKIEGKIENIN